MLFKKEREKKHSHREFLFDKENKAIFDSKGLLPVVIQESRSRDVLHIGYMDKWALDSTLKEEAIYLYKRSKNRIQKFVNKHEKSYRVDRLILHSSRRAILIFASLPEGGNSDTEFTQKILPQQAKPEKDDAFFAAVKDADPDTLLGSPDGSSEDAFSGISPDTPKDPFLDDD